MKRLVFILILIISFSTVVWSQFSKLIEIKTSSEFFSTDNKNNIYFTEGDYLYKSEPPYLNKFSFYFGKHDPNYLIDASNPNQILLFFPEIQKVIILDSTLNETARPLYLDEIGMLDISLLASTPKGGYWFYNVSNNSLTGLNGMYIPLVKAINLDLFFTYPKMPNYLCAKNDKVFLNIPSDGVLIMSDLGRFITMVPLTGLIDFQIIGDDIIFCRDQLIHIYNIKKQNAKVIPLPNVPNIINALLSTEKLFLQTKEKIFVFNYE
jgi:hypothetical protein